MMTSASPHHSVREGWLALAREDALAPEQPIFDAHHHLWDRPEGRYRVADFLHDAADGHDVRASLFVQCRTGYRTDGPIPLRSVGEVETICEWGRASPRHPVGIVGFADLQMGQAVAPVLEALIEAGQGRLCGVRNTTAWHADSAVRSNPNPAPDGLLRSAAFLDGAREVAAHGLTLDIWAYQSQLDEVVQVAQAVPELTIVLDHCGGPLGVGPFRRTDPEVFRAWRSGLARVASLPNTRIKIGGFGLSVMGYDYATRALPPSSDELARDWTPWVDSCINLFGADRAMFESNFPVDKGQFSYRTLWNAFKRLSAVMSQPERDALFWQTAARCYGCDEQIFRTTSGGDCHE